MQSETSKVTQETSKITQETSSHEQENNSYKAAVTHKTTEKSVENYDAIIIGAGAAGLSATLGLVQSNEYLEMKKHGKMPSVLVISKLPALRSHTGSAEGGIAASLGNVEKDNWQWHYYDTVHGGDWLSDQDAAKLLAKEAPQTVIKLEHDGVAFSRTQDGHINQRRFGGHTANFGAQPVPRAAFAADRIGHQILYSLWQKCVAENITFSEDCYVTDIGVNHDSKKVEGILAFDLTRGKLREIHSNCVLVATGGAGRLFSTTSNSWDLTGDGMALALQAGLQIEDCEFIQFHPTGLAHTGILLSEAARAEGGVLRNAQGEAFMKNYDSTHADLAPRDVVARAIANEIREGRGVKDETSAQNNHENDCVWLDMTNIDADYMRKVLPQVTETIEQYAHLDTTKDLVPIRPTAHYTMGGIPITLNGEVYILENNTQKIIKGLYAAGECSCVGVHGANRLGGNSLLDACLFGERAGIAMAKELNNLNNKNAENTNKENTNKENTGSSENNTNNLMEKLYDKRILEINKLTNTSITNNKLTESCENNKEDSLQDTNAAKNSTNDENPYTLFSALGEIMERAAAISCDAKSLTLALQEINERLIPKIEELRSHSNVLLFNQELTAIWEIRNMSKLAKAVLQASIARHESRGSFFRRDYPNHDTNSLPQHSFVNSEGKTLKKPVNIIDFQPDTRKFNVKNSLI